MLGLGKADCQPGEGERAASLSVFRKGLSAADEAIMPTQLLVVKTARAVFPIAHITRFPQG
jgi:hypothetical protein